MTRRCLHLPAANIESFVFKCVCSFITTTPMIMITDQAQISSVFFCSLGDSVVNVQCPIAIP